MKIISVILVVLLCALLISFLRAEKAGQKRANLSIGEKKTYQVEIADNTISRMRGLSGRENLPEDAGMLFVFDTASNQSFWMKEMQFPLDMIWIRNFTVVAIDTNIPHPAANGGQIARMSPGQAVDMALEVNAGQVERFGIEVGDLVSF